jgi:tetratricopeptide (TPR) repeat protein
MAEQKASRLPKPTAEQRRVAAGQFERANQVITTGNYDYGIQLLLNCCQLDPGSFVYRQKLRQTEKTKYNNNLRGSSMAFLTTFTKKMRMRKALGAENYLKVLEYGEQVMARNPWDIGAQLAMAKAFLQLGLLDLAVWTLDQARQKNPKDLKVNRALAELYEKRGNFTQAIALWEMVRKANPADLEAQHKGKDLAASATIARGKYEEAIHANSTPPDDKALVETAADQKLVEATTADVPAAGKDKVAREVAPLLARIEADPKNPHVYLQLATLYRRSERFDEARAILQKGLPPTANNFELAVELADIEIEPFRRNLAVTEEKLRHSPKDADLHKIRTRLTKEINNRELNIYRLKAERYPTEMNHRFEMGVRLLKSGQVDEAIKELQTARNDPRHHARALLYLGYCFKSRNNWKLAQRNFEEALKSLPAGDEALRKDIMFQLAQGCADAGDLVHAVEIGMELANLDFGYKDIGRLLDEWQTKLQKA